MNTGDFRESLRNWNKVEYMTFFKKYHATLSKLWTDQEIEDTKKAFDDPPNNPWVLEKMQSLQAKIPDLKLKKKEAKEFADSLEEEIMDFQMFLQEAKCDPVAGKAVKHM